MTPSAFRRCFVRWSAMTAGLALAATSWAQVPPPPAAPTLLQGAQLSEASLVDALAIEAPSGAASASASRGFRPALPAEGAKPAAASAGRAHLQVTFVTNSASLTEPARGVLDILGRALMSPRLASYAFRIEGHADARGESERNLRLSQLRAEAVAAYLNAQHGLPADRLRAVGRGSSEPLNTLRPDAPENRRVTIVSVKN